MFWMGKYGRAWPIRRRDYRGGTGAKATPLSRGSDAGAFRPAAAAADCAATAIDCTDKGKNT